MRKRKVRTFGELAALPERSVIRDKFGDVYELRGGWWCGHECSPASTEYVARKWLPAKVLDTPKIKPNWEPIA